VRSCSWSSWGWETQNLSPS